MSLSSGNRIFVVAHRATDTNRSLAAALRRAGLHAEVVAPGELSAASPDDVALTRLDVTRSLDGIEPGLDAVTAAARRGVRVLNGVEFVVAAHDKLVTARVLRGAGIPHPWTTHVLGTTSPLVRLPVVLKPRFGSWGADVYRCDTSHELAARLVDLSSRGWAKRGGVLVQEYVPAGRSDLRVVVAGGRIVAASARVAAPGEWRTNVALGGRRRRARISRDARAVALAAAAAIGGDLVGIDLLATPDAGWTTLEVNAAVDFTTEYALRGRDPFAAVADALAAAVPEPAAPVEAPLAVPAAAFSSLSG